MRLWSLHPRYLDPQGLVALWREALLARAVLRGRTKGYRHHPQLDRFRAHRRPRSAISTYLSAVHAEAARRAYAFDAAKVGTGRTRARIPVTEGQIAFEMEHLLRKLSRAQPGTLPSMALGPRARVPSFDAPPRRPDRTLGMPVVRARHPHRPRPPRRASARSRSRAHARGSLATYASDTGAVCEFAQKRQYRTAHGPGGLRTADRGR